jgi:outer membrane protease
MGSGLEWRHSRAPSRGACSLRSAGGHMDGMDWMDAMDPDGGSCQSFCVLALFSGLGW